MMTFQGKAWRGWSLAIAGPALFLAVPAAAQGCYLGDRGCQFEGSGVYVTNDTLPPQISVMETGTFSMLVAVKCEGAPGMRSRMMRFLITPKESLGGEFSGASEQWQQLSEGSTVGSFEVPEQRCGYFQSVRYKNMPAPNSAGVFYVVACMPVYEGASDTRAGARCSDPLTLSVTARPQPDLAADITLNPTSATPGDNVELEVMIRNLGSAANAAEGFVDIAYTPDSRWGGRKEERIDLVPLPAIGPGESHVYRIKVQAPKSRCDGASCEPAFYRACAHKGQVSDIRTAVPEDNLANNCSPVATLALRPAP